MILVSNHEIKQLQSYTNMSELSNTGKVAHEHVISTIMGQNGTLMLDFLIGRF